MDYCVGKGWCLSEGDRLLEQDSKPMPPRSEQNGKGNISLLNFFQDCLGFHLDILWFNKQRFCQAQAQICWAELALPTDRPEK